MKNTIRKSNVNSINFNQFQSAAIEISQLSIVKGGENIITEEVIQQ